MKAQTSIEYLILIAAVLIVAIVSLTMVVQVAGTKTTVMYSSCQSAAEQCAFSLKLDPNYECKACETNCVDPTTNLELFDGAINCCKVGNSSMIYEGATSGCEYTPPVIVEPEYICGNNIIEPGEQCDGTNLGGATCESIMGEGWTGTLECYPPEHINECRFDTRDCTPPITVINEVVDSSGSHTGRWPSLALDSNDYPHIAYTDMITGFGDDLRDVKYAYWNGDSWNIEMIDNRESSFQMAIISLDSNDLPHVCYYHTSDNRVVYAKKHIENRLWNIQTTSSLKVISPSFSFDSINNPHIISQLYYAGDIFYYYLYYDGSTWYEDETTLGFGGSKQMDIDSNDFPHVFQTVLVDDTKSMQYSYWNRNAWISEIIDEVPDYTGTAINSLVLDDSDLPHVSYVDGQGASIRYLKYAYLKEDSSWEIKEVLTNPDNPITEASIFLSPTGVPFVSYSLRRVIGPTGWDATFDLYYAYPVTTGSAVGASSWNSVYIGEGLENSLVIDSQNRVHIAYNAYNSDDWSRTLNYYRSEPINNL